MITLQQQLDLDFNKVPANIQDFVLSNDVATTVDLIMDEYEIQETQREECAFLMFGLMIGSISVDRFIQELRYTYHLEEERANDMLLDVNETLLEQTTYLLQQAPNREAAHAAPQSTDHPVPVVSASQTPVSGLLEDHEHLGAHTHEGPVPLSRNGVPGNFGDIHDPDKDVPTYELK